jgi:hypothetical protein
MLLGMIRIDQDRPRTVGMARADADAWAEVDVYGTVKDKPVR